MMYHEAIVTNIMTGIMIFMAVRAEIRERWWSEEAFCKSNESDCGAPSGVRACILSLIHTLTHVLLFLHAFPFPSFHGLPHSDLNLTSLLSLSISLSLRFNFLALILNSLPRSHFTSLPHPTFISVFVPSLCSHFSLTLVWLPRSHFKCTSSLNIYFPLAFLLNSLFSHIYTFVVYSVFFPFSSISSCFSELMKNLPSLFFCIFQVSERLLN